MRCRPGDLALVIRAFQSPELLGRFVIVERRAVPGEVLHSVNGQRLRVHKDADWIVRAAGGGLMPCRDDCGQLHHLHTVAFRDASLLPIRPDELKGELGTEDEPHPDQAALDELFDRSEWPPERKTP